ncbi:CPBP family intramembrane metalloprotease [Bacillus timonensis]|nr:CPBP family intramembrane metalloprotease [Bacillus timonensis]
MITIGKFLLSYFILAFYFNAIPILVPMSDFLRFFQMLLFFPIALLVTKLFLKKGLQSFGLTFYKNWWKNLRIGFVMGFSVWALLFVTYFIVGRYEQFTLHIDFSSLLKLVVIFVGFGIGSLISDMITRGLVFGFFKEKTSFGGLMTLSIIVYTLDDMWYEGFSLQNTIFSIVLGISLAYVFYKTGSIWANTGIHFGLNVVYGMFFGISGHVGAGVFSFTISNSVSVGVVWLSTLFAGLLLVVVFACNKYLTIYQMK